MRSAAKELNISASSSSKSSEYNDDDFKKEGSDADPEADPLDKFGYGISAWMSQLRFLFKLYFGLTLLAFVLMKTYRDAGNISGGSYDFLARFSLGNIG